VARAIKDYAEAERADASTAAALTETGVDGALNYLDGLMHINDAQVQRGLAFFLSAIPLYWEPPEVSPEFRAVLEGDRRAA
jgi:hypothetical protein